MTIERIVFLAYLEACDNWARACERSEENPNDEDLKLQVLYTFQEMLDISKYDKENSIKFNSGLAV